MTFLTVLGTTIGSALASTTIKKVVKYGSIIAVITFIFSLIPPISLPYPIYNFLLNGWFKKFCNALYFYLPIENIVLCITFCLTLKYGKLIFKMLMFIYHKFFPNN